MAKKKKNLIKLVSTAGTGEYYTVKNSTSEKLELMKYDKKLRKRVPFKQKKID